ncbi:serine-enriched protein [Gigaspora margarita]|uniref:Serine-enriched protein n=1 Tax=Gigaspora margarita TaxID=4874 RepID=A0A8H3XIT1_GIGMA|nr:serine-enriched protein [Gigaspora margarita]
MEESTLINLLKCDSLWLEEKLEAIEIWEYLIKWGIKNTESILNDDLTKWTQTDFIELGKVLHNCIPHIRFSQLSHNKLRLIITQYKNILPDYFLEEIYNYLSDSKPKHNNLPKRGKSVFELEESKISGFVMSMFEKISRFIMSNGVQDVPEIRGLGMGSCIGCGAIKICAGCGELERCGTLKYCAVCGTIKRCTNCACIRCKYSLRGLGMGSCTGCGKYKSCLGCGELGLCGTLKRCAVCKIIKRCNTCACVICKHKFGQISQ